MQRWRTAPLRSLYSPSSTSSRIQLAQHLISVPSTPSTSTASMPTFLLPCIARDPNRRVQRRAHSSLSLDLPGNTVCSSSSTLPTTSVRRPKLYAASIVIDPQECKAEPVPIAQLREITSTDAAPELSWADHAQIMDSARSITHLRRLIRLLAQSSQYVQERASIRSGVLHLSHRSLNGKLLLRLLGERDAQLGESAGIGFGDDRTSALHMDSTCVSTLNLIRNDVGPECFTLGYLRQMARLAETAGLPRALEAAYAILDELLSTPKWQMRLQPSNGKGKERQLEEKHMLRLRAVSQAFMSSFARLGRLDRVHQCFTQANKWDVRIDMKQYQLKLVSILDFHLVGKRCRDGSRVRTSSSPEELSRELMAQIGKLRREMERKGVDMDDRFLSGVVHGLGAPLRSPLLQQLPKLSAQLAIETHRSILAAFLAKSQAITTPPKENYMFTGFRPSRLPSLLAALIQVELDTLRAGGWRPDLNTLHHVQQLISIIASGVNQQDHELTETESLSQATVAYIHVRVLVAQGDLNAAIPALARLLGLPLILDKNSAREQITKQRSAVILLFSAAIGPRTHSKSRDLALEVLETTTAHERFADIWRDRIHPHRHREMYDVSQLDPVQTLSRLWKRYMRAWSQDVAHGRRETGSFAAMNPWRALSRSIDAMSLALAKLDPIPAYPNRHTLASTTDRTTRQARRRPFGVIFNERNLVRSMIKSSLLGGRWSDQAAETATERRMARTEKVLKLFKEVNVTDRVWEVAEHTIIRQPHRGDRTTMSPTVLRELLGMLHRYAAK